MKSARGFLAAACALLAMLAGSCGGGGSSSSSTTPPPSTVSVTISPTSAAVGFGTTQQFTATVSGSTNTAVDWSVKDASGGTNQVGTINASGLYTAPDATSTSGQGAIHTVSVSAGQTSSPVNVTVPELNPMNSVTVTATSQADSSKSASATVTISGLAIVAIGQCPLGGGTCTAGVTGTQVSQGQTAILFIAGYGIVPGTTYSISGNPTDVVFTQPPASNFTTATDGTPVVYFTIVVSPTAALGVKNVVVTNPGGEVAAFPGGLRITQ